MLTQIMLHIAMWCVLSLPIGIFTGKAIAYGMGTDDED